MPPLPITEIALLHTKSNTAPSRSTIALLQQAQQANQAQAKFSSCPVSLFSQVEDPSFIYLVGGWNSLQQHYEEWIPSATNGDLMRRLVEEEGLKVVWMFHVEETDADGGSDGLDAVLKAPVVALGRYGINAAEKEGFVRVFGEMKRYLMEDTKPFPVFQGRVDKEEGREEVVLFSGWKELHQHLSFEELKEFKELKGNLVLVETKHLVRWEDKPNV